jgi:hypothetical protein
MAKEKQQEKVFRLYCPIIDQVVEAKDKEERNKKVQEIIKKQAK